MEQDLILKKEYLIPLRRGMKYELGLVYFMSVFKEGRVRGAEVGGSDSSCGGSVFYGDLLMDAIYVDGDGACYPDMILKHFVLARVF